MADYYDILGVSRGASSGEIRQAYLRLAREKHPDRFADPGEKEKAQSLFQDATAAFNTLSNERSRREYDAELARPKLTTPEEIARDAYARGLQSLQARDYQSAVELLRNAVHHVADDARYRAALAQALVRNPHWVRDAIHEMEKAIEIAPLQAPYHAQLAEMFHGQGLRLRARKALERAAELSTDDPEVRRVSALLGEDAGEADRR
ncbi:MAG: DnaJ domain-containing protein [Acidobacteria bacterium]|nr:DnaJ domain-containing protein [Acidobacteriota bacterium]